MSRLTKQQVKEKLQALSSDQQVEQLSDEAMDEAFLELVYNAHKQTSAENNKPFDYERAYDEGDQDGQTRYARWVLKSFFGINLSLLEQLLS